MAKDNASVQAPLMESEAVSWWSWRPGLKPWRAFVFGGLLSLLAAFLLVNGLTTLIALVLDNVSPPVRVVGVVTGHTSNMLGSPQLVIHLEQAGFPGSITLVVSPAAATELNNGSSVSVDYAPHQRIPYALEKRGRRYMLPDTGSAGTIWQSSALLVSGLLLLSYPSLLFFWGWRDLRMAQPCRRTARVVARRIARQTTARGPGLVPRATQNWHGVALQLENAHGLTPELLIFSVRPEQHEGLQRGQQVEITYSPHLHHLYTLKMLPHQV
jgi:hypothetical protein